MTKGATVPEGRDTGAANCTTLCHSAEYSASSLEGHVEHVGTQSLACTECHADNGSNYAHLNGVVNMVFTNAGSLEAAPVVGLGDAAYTPKGSFHYERGIPT